MSKMSVTLDVTNDNFAAVAALAGYVPRAQLEGYARHIAGEVLKQHNIVPPWEATSPGVLDAAGNVDDEATKAAIAAAEPITHAEEIGMAEPEPAKPVEYKSVDPVAPKRRGRPAKTKAQEEAVQELAAFAKNPDVPIGMRMQAAAAVVAATEEKPAEGSFAEAIESLDPKAAVSEESDQPAVPLTVEDVRSALRDVAARIDFAACRPLLDHFGAKKASDVPEEKMAAFVVASKLEAKTVDEFAAKLKIHAV